MNSGKGPHSVHALETSRCLVENDQKKMFFFPPIGLSKLASVPAGGAAAAPVAGGGGAAGAGAAPAAGKCTPAAL